MSFDKIIPSLAGRHDLRISRWGPYTKRYMGISHIPDPRAGLRFDLSVFPELLRSEVKVPNVKWNSGYHPWQAASDLSFYSHRHEIIWKDRLYCDVSFLRLDESAVLIRCTCVNRTELSQNLGLHYVAWLNFPPVRTYSDEALRMSEVNLPEKGVWIEGMAYDHIAYALDDPRANLTEDGYLRGEILAHGFVGGTGLGQGFGREEGDQASYKVDLHDELADSVIVLRYRAEDDQAIKLSINNHIDEQVELFGSGDFKHCAIPAGTLRCGENSLSITLLRGGEIEIDGFALVPADQVEGVQFHERPWNPVPERLRAPTENALVLQYEHIEPVYGLAWAGAPSRLRGFIGDDLDTMMRRNVNQHPQERFFGQGQGHYTDVFLSPIFLEAESERVFYGMICAGSADEVAARLGDFQADDPAWETAHQRASQATILPAPNAAGRGYRFSQERMAATLLTNVVYPVRTRGTWIRHNTPGRLWDCLYTWDSGFIGLGLLELDQDRAIDCLNAYVTEPSEEDAAFIHHGSPLPVQHYLFLELWNRTQSQALLAYFYPRLRRYHRFLSGRLGSSTTRTRLNLIRTWDYFYNSGGWDDYPPQQHVHEQGLEDSVTPVVNTAHAIRTAQILKMAATALDHEETPQEIAEYEREIEIFSQALQAYAWDEDSGYFGYVRDQAEGESPAILRHASGQNFNQGLDGVSPLVAGICTPEQEERLLSHLFSPEHLWTPLGLSTVDQSAPYYRTDGYWNGAVWMSHQWFLWKALLDMGRADRAHRIAATALRVWKQEVESSYNCFEHFLIETGRGAGWHHFGGLSSPVLNWYSAYHLPGHLSTGLDVWTESLHFSDDHTSLMTDLQLFGAPHHKSALIAVMNEDGSYAVSWNDQGLDFHERYPGVLEIQLPVSGRASGRLKINQQ